MQWLRETGTRERNNDSTGVTQVEVMVETGVHGNNDDTPSVTTNITNTSKSR